MKATVKTTCFDSAAAIFYEEGSTVELTKAQETKYKANGLINYFAIESDKTDKTETKTTKTEKQTATATTSKKVSAASFIK